MLSDLSAMDFEPILYNELDLPPEFCQYKDEGCELASSCLNCPFPQCILEIPRGKQHFLKSQRDKKIMEGYGEGKKADELAKEFDISRRTVQRVLQRYRSQNKTKERRGNEPGF